MESYRSGHNGAVLKTVRAQAHRGSNPLLSAKSLKHILCFKLFLLDFMLRGFRARRQNNLRLIAGGGIYAIIKEKAPEEAGGGSGFIG